MYESSSFPTSSPTLVFTCFVFGYSHPSRSRPSRHLLFVFVRTHSGKCDRNLAQTSLNKQNKHKVGGWAAGFIVSSNWKVQPSWIWVLTWCLQSTLTSFSEQCSLEVALVLQQFQEFAFCLFSKLAECISLPGLLVSELRHSLVLMGHVIFPGSYFPPWTQMLPSMQRHSQILTLFSMKEQASALALSSRETGDGVYPTPVVKVLRPLGSGSSRDHHEPAVNGS